MSADDDDAVICYGGAKLGDVHLLADVVAVDDEIYALLAPVSFTDTQLTAVMTAAAKLPYQRRGDFLVALANALTTSKDGSERE